MKSLTKDVILTPWFIAHQLSLFDAVIPQIRPVHRCTFKKIFRLQEWLEINTSLT
jgi:hypothetical protein